MMFQKQRGVVLIVCLVILAVVTLLGVSAIESSGMEMKMVTNTQERQLAFNAAETTLRQAERSIETVGYSRIELQSGCAGSSCFNNTCANGLCFVGQWLGSDPQNQCLRYTTVNPPTVQVWEDPALDVWETASRHGTVAIDGNGNDGRFIIEFLCFIEPPGITGAVAGDVGDVHYRITAMGTSNSGRSEVVLQSTYRAPTP
ncbi:MAG: PilX N-terminal domain-containing pilus assembly protein [Oceanicoccus sp.]